MLNTTGRSRLLSVQEARASLSYREDTDSAVLGELELPFVGFVTWSRTLPEPIENELAAWGSTADRDFEATISTSHYSLDPALQGMRETVRDWMRQDMALLIAHFSAITRTTELNVSFETIRSDRCRKFHQDNLRYRLVCTYRGPGTEWVPAEFVEQSVLDNPPQCHKEANRRILKESGAIRRASTGDVVMMKGERHPDGTAVVHRSPPIEGSGNTRIALILSTKENY